MGRHYHFRPGSFYRVDDRTGFAQRAERTREQWDGLIVDEKVWEPRQPQDLVRGRQDKQSVEDARPLAPNQFVGPKWTSTTSAVAIMTVVIPVDSLGGFSVGDLVSIMTDANGGTLFKAYLVAVGYYPFPGSGGPNTSAIVINTPLQSPISAGAQIWNYGPIDGGPPTMAYFIPSLFTLIPFA